MFKQLRWKIGTAWCGLAHQSLMWPVHGYYKCRICGRRYSAFGETPRVEAAERAAWKPAISLMLALALVTVAHRGDAGDVLKGHATPEAAAALERYTSAIGPDAWNLESVEIHAALPRLQKTGTLLAIRRLLPVGQSRYDRLQFSGDRTVKDQVIVRYLNAEKHASEIPAGQVAITPANYKFAYKGTVDDAGRHAFVFQITPRHKRIGLIKGELWLDRSTGAAIRKSGRLVKSPSIFVKGIDVTQENTLRAGVVESRLTHVTVETRLVGRAELVVEEHPVNSEGAVDSTGSDYEGGQQ